jgi:hypothetical protein
MCFDFLDHVSLSLVFASLFNFTQPSGYFMAGPTAAAFCIVGTCDKPTFTNREGTSWVSTAR